MIDSRADVQMRYEVDEGSRIRTPGRFEASMIFVPYLWEQHTKRNYEQLEGGEVYIKITEEDKKQFPELNEATGAYLLKDDFGYIQCYVEEV
jgi:hypothetical protein